MRSKSYVPLSVSIKASLLSAILFLLAALASVSALSTVQSQALFGSIETMGRQRLPEVQKLGEFELAATRIRLTAIRLALSTSQDRKAEAAKLLDERRRELGDQLAAHEQEVAGDPEAALLYADFLAKWRSYLALQARFAEFAGGDREALDRLVNFDSFAAFNEVVAAIDNNIRFASLRAEDAVASAEAHSRGFAMGLLAVNLAAALIGLATLAFVTREVSLPIRRMTDAMGLIAKGRLDTDIPFADRNNELGLMARALAVFRRSLVENERLSAATRTLSELSEWLQSAKTEPELYGMISDVLGGLMPECRGALFIFDKSRETLQLAANWNGAEPPASIRPDDCWSLRRGHAYAFGSHEVEFRCAHCATETSSHYCCIPILAHGETVGLLHLDYAYEGAETAEEARERFADRARLGKASAEHMSVAIANAKLREDLRDQSMRDALTGLPNRRGLEGAVATAAREGEDVAALVIDVDHFKRFNDVHGHDAGDAVLRAVGGALQRTLRPNEFACRFGGEEFVVLLAGLDLRAAARRAEDFRIAVAALALRHGGEELPSVTVSIGAAAEPARGFDLEACLKAADDALYQAKANGRNRVETAGGPAELKALAA